MSTASLHCFQDGILYLQALLHKSQYPNPPTLLSMPSYKAEAPLKVTVRMKPPYSETMMRWYKIYLTRLTTLHSCRQDWSFCPWQLPPPWTQPPCLVTPHGCNRTSRNPWNCRWTTNLPILFDHDSSLHDIEWSPGYEHIHHFFSVLIKPEPGEGGMIWMISIQ